MLDLIEISKSWITSFNPSPEQKEIAEYRISECNKCPNKKQLPIINSYICGLCSCPLDGKIFSSKQPPPCPDSRWKK